MKKLLMLSLIILASSMTLTGCNKMIPVSQQQIGTKVSGSNGKFYDGLYRAKTMKISDWCGTTTRCDKALVMNVPAHNHAVPGEYAMPLSNDQDLTLDLEFRLRFDMTGGEAEILKRMQKAALRYKMQVEGSSSTVQVQRIDIAVMAALDLSPAIVKTKIRPEIANYTLETAFRNVGQGGSILYGGKDPEGKTIDGILAVIKQHLKDIDSDLIIETVAVKRIAMPESITRSKKEIEEEAQKEDKQRLALQREERQRVQRHLLNMRQAADELEVLAVQAPVLNNPNIIAYKWTQVAAEFAMAGLPFAITPEMLAIGQGGAIAVEDIELRIRQIRTKADEFESSGYYQCLQNKENSVEICNEKYPNQAAKADG